jgi:hypothetical protein
MRLSREYWAQEMVLRSMPGYGARQHTKPSAFLPGRVTNTVVSRHIRHRHWTCSAEKPKSRACQESNQVLARASVRVWPFCLAVHHRDFKLVHFARPRRKRLNPWNEYLGEIRFAAAITVNQSAAARENLAGAAQGLCYSRFVGDHNLSSGDSIGENCAIERDQAVVSVAVDEWERVRRR